MGSDFAATWTACKAGVAALAEAVPNATVADFMLPSPITADAGNYWDPVHYRVPMADRIMADLAAATVGDATADDRLLTPERAHP